MNNPGIDLEIWKQLRKKWTDLDASGHKLKVDFKLITDPKDKKKVLAIDVVQYIDNEIITQTVQRSAGEAYALLGVSGLSIDGLVQVCKEMMHQLHSQYKQRDAALIVSMSPRSPASGETKGVLEANGKKNSVVVNYRYYYVLTALREKMIESVGNNCRKVSAIYCSKELEFYFEY